MEELIDIHSHLLEGVDDGARNREESLKILQIYYKEGIRHIILTPHFHITRKSASYAHIEMAIEELKREMVKDHIDISLYHGNELYYGHELISSLENKVASTINGTNYILVEFNPLEEYSYIKDAFFTLVCNDYLPILAHIERYECLFQKKERITDLKRCGIKLQLNAAAILGNDGREYKKRTKYILEKELADFIATDAHDSEKRKPCLKECANLIEKKYGREYRELLFLKNPRKLIENTIE